ncbi:hypothetical protein GUITHDRAFT_138633 [Guillardia theta CCMP2712]|uniref:RRM domain-containing protein n=1 Tax=Guillardia theta (strain CCMP2712) TaxID=905079 RepID=L1JB44_GUITC|nr:hypothetical protein GUITHDRAFT_138633 [Guillardia theta CCMP2712]EKX45758.1 hypothetical protein GUITHDRAFT_138633 [Guillardia theta CCMP2712]|eukprot:XP_005832738.1 hypothetical protein GUITHDRAFT_138633 [Guillardia theta CCMP2712]
MRGMRLGMRGMRLGMRGMRGMRGSRGGKMPKVLVCGDAQGNLDELFNRVATVNAKNGPFDMLLCAGEFFSSADVGGEDDDQPNYVDQDPLKEKEYVTGAKKAPLPTYFICGKGIAHLRWVEEVAKNIFFLGNHGIRELHGLRVGYLCGSYSMQASESLETMQWPLGVNNNLQGQAAPDGGKGKMGTSVVTSVAKTLRPRYHFAGSEGIFYERAPYVNSSPSDREGAVKHITRFLGIARVGNPDKKQRWLYAANITPVTEMTMEALTTRPANTTASPYESAPAPTFQAGGDLRTTGGREGGGAAPQGAYSETICHVANLPYKVNEDTLMFAFAGFGDILRVHIARDRETKRARGFGFVEFKDKEVN